MTGPDLRHGEKAARLLHLALALAFDGALLCCPGCGGPRVDPTLAPASSAALVPVVTPSTSMVAPIADGPKLPPTPRRPSITDYHGVRVTDDYAWLEDPKAPEVKEWIQAEGAYTRSFLDKLPDRAHVKTRVSQLLTSRSPAYSGIRYRAGLLFALKDQPPKEQPLLVVLKSADDLGSEHTLVDPNEIDPSGKTTIDFFVPSRDGKWVAVSLSKGGSESGSVSVYDVATKRAKEDLVPRVNGGTAGGSLAWNSGGTGFYYTRYPREGERPPGDIDFYQEVYFHQLGTNTTADTYSIGKDFPRIAETALESSEDGRFTLARVANGDGGEFAFCVRGPDGAWSRIADFRDKAVDAHFGRDNGLYLLSLGAGRGQVLRLHPATKPIAEAEIVVPESDVTIARFVVTSTRLYVVDRVGGPSQVRTLSTTGKKIAEKLLPVLPVSSVSEMEALAGDAVLFRNESYLEPPAWYRYDPKTSTTRKTALVETSIADMQDAEVVRETCVSKDGTKLPVSIVRRKGAKVDGSSIALLTGYGGYGISRTPKFRPMNRLWLDQGGIIAEANLRGGGEFGEAWHLQGNLTKKQNVFDDFYACAKLLLAKGVTVPERLAIIGRSNGGLLMGAEIVQHPDMFRAVVSEVGIYDMLKVETTPNGAFNVTEFGSVEDPAQFRALYAYSPYHNVKDETRYPSVLFTTGANDPRVDPYNSRKMTARLQATTVSKNPILLRSSQDTGHGMGTPLSAQIDENTDIYSFFFHELAVPFRPAP
jgi:prolyl oligopeptidase